MIAYNVSIILYNVISVVARYITVTIVYLRLFAWIKFFTCSIAKILALHDNLDYDEVRVRITKPVTLDNSACEYDCFS